MELFQTIWTALTTENELLTSIIILPVCFIESTINLLIFTTLFNINVSMNKKVKYVLLLYT